MKKTLHKNRKIDIVKEIENNAFKKKKEVKKKNKEKKGLIIYHNSKYLQFYR